MAQSANGPMAQRLNGGGGVVGWGGVGWWDTSGGADLGSSLGGVDRGGRLVAVSVTDTEHPNRPGRWGRPGEYQS